jgi:3-hydroxyisobutyrate dehydrogenase-like beta-hydroxyacid dehydrogenase
VEAHVSRTLRIGLLGLGEVGNVLAEDLREHTGSLVAWDPQFASATSTPSMSARRLSLIAAPDAAAAAAGADIIVSAVTAAQCIAAANSVSGHLKPGAWYLDLNSVSPGSRRQAADVITGGGGRFVEVAVMSPISPQRLASPMLSGGPHAADFRALAAQLGFESVQFFSDRVGDASAAKMCRSVVVKGLEALVLESLLTARTHGVESAVLESLQGLLGPGDWRASARYMIARTQLHGRRRAEEMREVARTVREAGHPSPMSEGSAAWQDWAAGRGTTATSPELEQVLDSLNEARSPRPRP